MTGTPAPELLEALRSVRAGADDVNPAALRALVSLSGPDRGPYVDALEFSPRVVAWWVRWTREGPALWSGGATPHRYMALVLFATAAEIEAAKSVACALARHDGERAAAIVDPDERREAMTVLFECWYPEDCRWWDDA